MKTTEEIVDGYTTNDYSLYSGDKKWYSEEEIDDIRNDAYSNGYNDGFEEVYY